LAGLRDGHPPALPIEHSAKRGLVDKSDVADSAREHETVFDDTG
jgi:hypothetical protein